MPFSLAPHFYLNFHSVPWLLILRVAYENKVGMRGILTVESVSEQQCFSKRGPLAERIGSTGDAKRRLDPRLHLQPQASALDMRLMDLFNKLSR